MFGRYLKKKYGKPNATNNYHLDGYTAHKNGDDLGMVHTVCMYVFLHIYIYMGMSINSGMDRSAVIRTMDRECLRKVPDPYPFVRAHHSIQTVLILLLSPTCYYFSSCYSCC